MVSSHLSLFLFANLITSFAYGKLEAYLTDTRLDINYIVISGIAATLFVRCVGVILRRRKSTGKFNNIPLVVSSVLIFLFTTLVSFVFEGLSLSNPLQHSSSSECCWFVCQHMEDVCSLWDRPRVISEPYQNTCEDRLPDRPIGRHFSGRCSDGKVSFTSHQWFQSSTIYKPLRSTVHGLSGVTTIMS
jgi:hypothetical protein